MGEEVRKKARTPAHLERTFVIRCSKCGERRRVKLWGEALRWFEWEHPKECPAIRVYSEDEKLDCYFCTESGESPQRFLRFKDFKDLALHVQQYHSENQKGETEMRTRNTVPAPREENIQLPEPVAGESNDFLKPEDLGSGVKSFVLTGEVRKNSGIYGEGIILTGKLGKQLYDFDVKFVNRNGQTTGNYKRLHKRFGANLKRWKGTIKVQVKEYSGQEYVAVVG